jgi:antirestriction protein ArdC
MPVNATTERPYGGIFNPLVLGMVAAGSFDGDNRWAGFGQWKKHSNPVRKGQTGTPIWFPKMACADCGTPIQPWLKRCRGGHDLTRKGSTNFVGWGSAQVFNNQQTREPIAKVVIADVDPSVGFEKASALIVNLEADLRHGGGRAYYSPREDYIQMPEAGAFKTSADYWATNLHEHAHWTGHASRLNRKGIVRTDGFRSDDYAFEELVAELASAFMCQHIGIEREGLIEHHAAYLACWKKRLTDEPEALRKAASLAGASMRYMMDKGEGQGE